MNKQIFKTFLRYNWWKIIGIALVGSIVLGYISQVKTKYKDDEIIHLFVAGTLENKEFNKKYYEMFHPEDKIEQINTTAIKYSDAKYQSAFKSIFNVDSDLIIVPESHLKDNDEFKALVYKFNQTESDYISNKGAEIYKFKEFTIGLKIYSKEDKTYNSKFKINEYFTFDETSYLFIDSTSTNLKTIGYESKNVAWNAFDNFISLS